MTAKFQFVSLNQSLFLQILSNIKTTKLKNSEHIVTEALKFPSNMPHLNENADIPEIQTA
jgi:hypothetical protein